MAAQIEILVERADSDSWLNALTRAEVPFESAQHRGVDGSDVVSLLIVLGPPAIAGIVAVARAQIQSRKFVKLKYRGMEVQGVSEDSVERILEKIASAEAHVGK